jgi:uncharacterized protein (DUF362 family)
MSEVSIIKCDDYEKNNVRQTVRKSLDLIGGLDKIVKKGDKVLLKVNLTSSHAAPERAVTTHPSVVGAVAEIVKELGAEIRIGDSSGGYEWRIWRRLRKISQNKFANMCFEKVSDFFTRLRLIEDPHDILSMKLQGESEPVFTAEELGLDELEEETFIKTGLKEVGDKFGAKLTLFDREEWIELPNPQGVFLKKVWVTKAITDADVIINMPKLKTHDIMLYTGAIKNFLGAVPGKYKSLYHQVSNATGNMGEMLVDIFSLVNPQLSIMDGIVGMEENGPTRGLPRKIGIIAASRDSVALDAVSSAVINYDPLEIHTTRIAANRNLGIGDLGKINVLGEPIKKVKIKDFKRPTWEGL